MSKGLTSKGEIYLEGKLVTDFSEYNNIIGYVTQEDILMETLTPRGKMPLYTAYSFLSFLRNFIFLGKVQIMPFE